MAGPDANLGTATVKVKVDTTEVKPALDQTQAEVADTTQKIGRDTEKNLGGGFTKVGDAISNATAPVRKFASAITATVGVATGLLGSFVAINGILRLIERAADSVRQRFKEVSELTPGIAKSLEDSAAAIQKQRDITAAEVKLTEDLAALEKVRAEDIYRIMSRNQEEIAAQKLRDAGFEIETGFQIKKQIDERIAATKVQLGQIRDRKGEEQKYLATLKETTEELLKQVEAIKSQEDAYFALAQRVAEFRSKRAKEREEEEQAEKAADAERRRRTRDAIREETLDRIKSIRERHEEELRLQRERERDAKAQAEAVAKAIENVNDRITNLNDTTSNTMEAMLRRIEVFVDNQGFG